MRKFSLFFDFFGGEAKKRSKNWIFWPELEENRFELGEKRIAPLPTTHPFSAPFVFLDHPFGLFCLVFVVRRLGLLKLLFRLFLHFFHLPIGLALSPRTVGSARSEEQNKAQQAYNDGIFPFHIRYFDCKCNNFSPMVYLKRDFCVTLSSWKHVFYTY